MAIFEDCNTGRKKTVHFGAAGMGDFILYQKQGREVALLHKQRYIERHRRNENWNDPTTAGSLSLNILWNKPTLKASIADYKRRFGF